jgi:hypothetical protein
MIGPTPPRTILAAAAVQAEAQIETAIEVAPFLTTLHGEILHGSIIGKLTGEYITLATIPANARVFRVVVGQKEAWAGAGLTFDSKLVNSLSDTAFDRTGISSASLVSFLTIERNLMGDIITWKKEVTETILKLKLTSDVVDVEVGDVLEYWIQYIQE